MRGSIALVGGRDIGRLFLAVSDADGYPENVLQMRMIGTPATNWAKAESYTWSYRLVATQAETEQAAVAAMDALAVRCMAGESPGGRPLTAPLEVTVTSRGESRLWSGGRADARKHVMASAGVAPCSQSAADGVNIKDQRCDPTASPPLQLLLVVILNAVQSLGAQWGRLLQQRPPA